MGSKQERNFWLGRAANTPGLRGTRNKGLKVQCHKMVDEMRL
jgi:hypothetical protein